VTLYAANKGNRNCRFRLVLVRDDRDKIPSRRPLLFGRSGLASDQLRWSKNLTGRNRPGQWYCRTRQCPTHDIEYHRLPAPLRYVPGQLSFAVSLMKRYSSEARSYLRSIVQFFGCSTIRLP